MSTGYDKYKIDITMPAVIRPALLQRTLESLIKNVVDDMSRFRLIINVDPIGENLKSGKVVKTAQSLFPNVVFNIPKTPSFAKAVKWVWSQTETKYVLHFEDDWIVNRKVDINDMIKILDKHRDFCSLRMYKHATPKNRTSMHTFSCRWIYNTEGYYLAKDWKKQFGLNPVLLRKDFIDEALPLMRDNINPEKQFRYSQEYMRPIIKKWKYAIYAKPGERPLVSDTGREWIKNTEYVKPKGTFLTWEKKK